MRPGLQNDLNVVGIGKGAARRNVNIGRNLHEAGDSHESESARPSRLVVLHHYAVNDFTIAAEVALQAVLGCLPTEASDEKFPARAK